MFPRICRFYRNASVVSKVQMLLKVTSYFFVLVTFARNTSILRILTVQIFTTAQKIILGNEFSALQILMHFVNHFAGRPVGILFRFFKTENLR